MVLVLSACSERAAEKAEDTQQQAATTGTESLSLINQENMLAHLEHLASDELAGRDAGKPGYDLAAKYVAEQFAAIGLEPGGTEGWYQPVELQSYIIDTESPQMTIHRDEGDVELGYREDFLMRADKVRAENSVRGEVVYVGPGSRRQDRCLLQRWPADDQGRQAGTLFVQPYQGQGMGQAGRRRRDQLISPQVRKELPVGARCKDVRQETKHGLGNDVRRGSELLSRNSGLGNMGS
jgi:hypothetical protein